MGLTGRSATEEAAERLKEIADKVKKLREEFAKLRDIPPMPGVRSGPASRIFGRAAQLQGIRGHPERLEECAVRQSRVHEQGRARRVRLTRQNAPHLRGKFGEDLGIDQKTIDAGRNTAAGRRYAPMIQRRGELQGKADRAYAQSLVATSAKAGPEGEAARVQLQDMAKSNPNAFPGGFRRRPGTAPDDEGRASQDRGRRQRQPSQDEARDGRREDRRRSKKSGWLAPRKAKVCGTSKDRTTRRWRPTGWRIRRPGSRSGWPKKTARGPSEDRRIRAGRGGRLHPRPGNGAGTHRPPRRLLSSSGSHRRHAGRDTNIGQSEAMAGRMLKNMDDGMNFEQARWDAVQRQVERWSGRRLSTASDSPGSCRALTRAAIRRSARTSSDSPDHLSPWRRQFLPGLQNPGDQLIALHTVRTGNPLHCPVYRDLLEDFFFKCPSSHLAEPSSPTKDPDAQGRYSARNPPLPVQQTLT